MNTLQTCSIEGCGGTYRVITPREYGQPLCGKHNSRFYRYGHPLGGAHWGMPTREQRHRTCKFDGCGRWTKAKGYCDSHYRQLSLGKELTPIGYRPPPVSCLYCDRQAAKREMCFTHYGRWRRGSDLNAPIIPLGQPRLDWSEESIRAVGVDGAHGRATRLWGRASLHPCMECGDPAKHWAYDGTDPTQLLGQHGKDRNPVWYSAYPEFYMPMCIKCHHGRDKAKMAAELREYREWKMATGLSLGRVS